VMDRHTALLAALALATACATGRPQSEATPATAGGGTPSARLHALADEMWDTTLAVSPTIGTFLGLPGARHDRMDDNSLETVRRLQDVRDAWWARLQALPTETFNGTNDAVLLAIVRETLATGRQRRICRGELMPVSQLFGWQGRFAYLAQIQPVGAPEARSQALARWRQLPAYLERELAALREGVRQGYVVPAGNVRVVLTQLDAILALGPDSSPFADPGRRDSTTAFRAAWHELMEREIMPAVRAYRDYLATEYLPHARTTTALSALPHGAECYRALVRAYTTLDRDPTAVHQLGLREMERVERDMRTIAERSFGTSDVRALLVRLRTDSQYTFRSRDEMRAVAEAALARAKAAAPRMFTRTPKADVIVDPCQAFEEESGCPGSYVPPAIDGSHPGRYRINLHAPRRTPRAGAEATAFHEMVPGHHFQIALSLEREGVPPLERFYSNSGFAEGWALYAEQLAHEMGLYSSDLDELGRLSEDALRAARLVVDPGLHVLGWSRQQAIDYMLAHTAQSEAQATSEVDRYIITPGQATAYMIGRLEIERLRQLAATQLGSRFDVREFHQRILEDGTVPLPLLGEKIDRWIASAR